MNLRLKLQRPVQAFLESARRTPSGRVLAGARQVVFESPSGSFPPVRAWTYERSGTRLQMTVAFVPYAGDKGMFCAVHEAATEQPAALRASVQFALGPDRIVALNRGFELRHSGLVTLGRGGINREKLVTLFTKAAPEALELLRGKSRLDWPIVLGSTVHVAALVDRMFLYAFAVEQAKRHLSQDRAVADKRHSRPRPLLPSLDATTMDDEPGDDVKANSRAKGRAAGRLSTEARIEVERHAVEHAIRYFVRRGYVVREVGKPYDLECTRGGDAIRVEVKGTTTAGESVELTIGEVRHARKFRKMVLFVVCGIELKANGRAHGGRVVIRNPWRIDEHVLEPTRFSCSVSPKRGKSG